jgi:hypothetical protein
MNRVPTLRGKKTTFALSMILLLLAEVSVWAQPSARRRDWIPSGEYVPILGDLWTFRCPPGSTFQVSADTMADNGIDSSNLDLYLEITDATGTLVASADETNACEHTPVCGFLCPATETISCGKGGLHTIAVVSMPSPVCKGGGGYKLELTVTRRNGKVVTDVQTGLGGGPRRRVPKWADGVGPMGPLLNDEAIPTSVIPIGDATLKAIDADRAASDSTPGK